MLKKIIQCFLLILTMMYLNGASLVWGMYQVNQQYYELNCENKSKPYLACNGKCQAKKQIDDLESHQNTDVAKSIFPSVVMLAYEVTHYIFTFTPLNIQSAFPLSLGHTKEFISIIVQPPD